MFNRMLQFFGLRPGKEPVEPKESSGEIVSEEDPGHLHKFVGVQWDTARFGPSVVDFDKNYSTPFGYLAVTYKFLSRCSCGREIVTPVRVRI